MRKMFILALALSTWSVWAQEVSPPPTAESASVFDLYPQAVGFTTGDLNGPGFVYRRWAGDWGFQANGLVIFNPNRGFNIFGSDYWMHSTGVSVLRSLFKGEPADWVYTQLYINGHLAFTGRQSWDTLDFFDTNSQIKPYSGTLNTGAGMGVEVGFFRHLSWIFEVSQRVKIPVINGTGTEKMEVGPQFQISTLYRF